MATTAATMAPLMTARRGMAPPTRLQRIHRVMDQSCSVRHMTRAKDSAKSIPSSFVPTHPTHLVFGANTDVGKTIASAGLVRAALRSLATDTSACTPLLSLGGRYVHYLKPLQCGGSDGRFVERHAVDGYDDRRPMRVRPHLRCSTLFEWSTPASPHVSSRLESSPASDREVLAAVVDALEKNADAGVTIVETAGGAMSPSSASPLNVEAWHSRARSLDGFEEGGGGGGSRVGGGGGSEIDLSSWGWSTQADLYSPLLSDLNVPAVLVGDARLGGISVTLSCLEALETRGYSVRGVVLIDDGRFGLDNARAIEEYVGSADGRRERRRRRQQQRQQTVIEADEGLGDGGWSRPGVHLLPPIPPMPEPLDGWFAKEDVERTFDEFIAILCQNWMRR